MINQILNADLLDPTIVYNLLGLDFTGPEQFVEKVDVTRVITYQIQDMGYDTFDPILNLGGIFLLFLAYLLQVSLCLVLKIVVSVMHNYRLWQKKKALRKNRSIPNMRRFKWLLKKIGNIYLSLVSSLVFGQIIIILFESVFQITVCVLIYFQKSRVANEPIENKYGPTYWVSTVTLYTILVLLVFLVYISFRVLRVDGAVLRNKEIEKMFGFIWEGIDIRF